MATLATPVMPSAEQRERLFFLIMAMIIGMLTIAGFVMNNLSGQAVANPPLVYHMHALAYGGFLALFVAQGWFAYRNDLRWHRILGTVTLAWIPLMVALGVSITIASIRGAGGPPVIAMNDFLFVNVMHVVSFAALTGVAAAMWRKNDWHRRFMLVALASIGAPGIARLLPLPLFVPYVFPVLIIAAMLFPAFAAAVDLRRTGRLHPAWVWGIGSVFAMLVVGQTVAATDWGMQVTQDLIAGTTGAQRPMEAFVPG